MLKRIIISLAFLMILLSGCKKTEKQAQNTQSQQEQTEATHEQPTAKLAAALRKAAQENK